MQDDHLTCACGHKGYRHSDLDLDALGGCYDCEDCDQFRQAKPGMFRSYRPLAVWYAAGCVVWVIIAITVAAVMLKLGMVPR